MMMGFKETYEFYLKTIKKTFIIVLLIFLLVSVISAVFFAINPDQAYKLIKYFMDNVKIFDAGGNISVIKLILNNIKASFFAIIIGVVPFLCLSSISIIVNGIMIGAVLALQGSIQRGMLAFVLGILPHGIFELTAFMISISVGIRLSILLGQKIRDKNDTFLKEMLVGAINTFVFFVIPLLIISGFIEVYITPMLLRLI